jgi:EAL and modified HD-GYP domain-containing signal transduction protein
MMVICKQAIFDREGKVAFYEVLLQDRSKGKYPEGLDPLKATSMVIDMLVEIGPERVGNGKLVFVNVPAIFLEASLFDLLSPEYVGIELVENRRINNELLDAIRELVSRGFKFSVDDFGFEKVDYLPLLGKCHFVKINLKDNPYNDIELTEVIDILKSLGKGVIAKNIETEEEYRRALDFGFDYFQGIYLSKPSLLKDTRTIAFLKSTIIRMYNAIRSRDVEGLTEVIEKDVGMSYKLLKFVNYMSKNKFSTIREAVINLGLENTAKLAVVVALSEVFAEEQEVQLWKRALFRASLAEKMAEVYSGGSKDKAYLLGLFSLSNEVLGENPADIARKLSLGEEIIQAYENRLTPLGFILSLVELLEDTEDEIVVSKVARILNITPERVYEMLLEAREEADSITAQSVA